MAASLPTRPSSNPSPDPRFKDWRRTGDPGSAFSGLSRPGRGRATTTRAPRPGGRQSRGRPPADHPHNPTPPPKVEDSSKPNLPPSPAILPNPSVSKPSVPTPPPPNKPKSFSTRPSRANPILVIDPSNLTEQPSPTITGSPSARSSSRRRRSQHAKPPASASAKLDIPSPHSRPQRSRSGPASPSITSKDIPPHLIASDRLDPTPDVRNNIDALVERVRAVAMAENRPSTPGSHIDWAGDDDDTLPDLDDWGVNTGTNSADGKSGGMSPLSVSGLMPLPEPVAQPYATSLVEDTPSHPPPSVQANGDAKERPDTLDSPPEVVNLPNKPFLPSERRNSTRSQAPPPLQLTDDKPATEKIPIASAPSDRSFSLAISPPPKPLSSKSEHFKLPLHPSLPPKPVASAKTLIAHPKPDINAMPMRAPVPLIKSADNPDAKVVAPAVEAIEPPNTKSPVEELTPNPILHEGVASPVHSPHFTSIQPSVDRGGLAASIHASKTPPESLSGTSQASQLFKHLAPTPYNPAHSRNRTLGRLYPPSGEHPPFVSRSCSSTPRGHLSGYHARTHSTPPPSNHRAAHTSRPVLTNNAISQIARAMGNSSISPPKTAGVTSCKE